MAYLYGLGQGLMPAYLNVMSSAFTAMRRFPQAGTLAALKAFVKPVAEEALTQKLQRAKEAVRNITPAKVKEAIAEGRAAQTAQRQLATVSKSMLLKKLPLVQLRTDLTKTALQKQVEERAARLREQAEMRALTQAAAGTTPVPPPTPMPAYETGAGYVQTGVPSGGVVEAGIFSGKTLPLLLVGGAVLGLLFMGKGKQPARRR